MKMDDQQRIAFLRDEYLHIQKVIEDFDGRALTIKAWSISFSLVAIAGAFVSHAPTVFLIASFSSGLFWLIEGFWKSFQNAYYKRSQSLESFFSGQNDELVPFQTGSSWYIQCKSGGFRRLRRIMLWPYVALPHILIAVLGITLFALHSIGFMTFPPRQ